jgi:hypothetical protein
MAITRTAMVDDDGTGTTGTIINNAWKTEFYNQIDAALLAVAAPYSAAVATNTTQSIPTGAWTTLTFQVEEADVGGLFTLAQPTRLTIPAGAAGLYLITATVTMAPVAGAAQAFLMALMINANFAMFVSAVFHASGSSGGIVTAQWPLNAGDYLELQVIQGTGSANLSGGSPPSASRFAINRLHA